MVREVFFHVKSEWDWRLAIQSNGLAVLSCRDPKAVYGLPPASDPTDIVYPPGSFPSADQVLEELSRMQWNQGPALKDDEVPEQVLQLIVRFENEMRLGAFNSNAEVARPWFEHAARLGMTKTQARGWERNPPFATAVRTHVLPLGTKPSTQPATRPGR
jgi:hypothetical protein